MKKAYLISALFALTQTCPAQQVSDPVLMTVNGKPITRAEFEYSYNKNGNVKDAVEKKTVQEYVPMFIDYKLKVAAAEAARLDTLDTFIKEFHTYRDMQLTPYMIDAAFIDSVAHVVYARTLKQLNGHDLLRPAHILVRLKQDATDAEKSAAKSKADSIYAAIKQGEDFSVLARKYSEDPGSAKNGGQLPWIGPGTTVKEFEEAAYTLQAGDTSTPVLSPFGYHIIHMTERKPFDSFEKVRPEIIESLKRQNIEEASAEHRIKNIVAQSHGRLTREAVLDSVMNAQFKIHPELRYLIQEYHDGLLLYEISKRQIWDRAANDHTGLERWFKKHKKQYRWTEPHFSGYVVQCANAQQKKAVFKTLKKTDKSEWRKAIQQSFNKDSITVTVTGPYLCKSGENPYIDAYGFKKGNNAEPNKGFSVVEVYGKVMKQPKSYLDVKAQVTTDYQNHLEQEWVNSLRQQYPSSIDNAVLQTVISSQ